MTGGPSKPITERVAVARFLQAQSTVQIPLITPPKMRSHFVLDVDQRRVRVGPHASLETRAGQEERATQDFIIRGLVL